MKLAEISARIKFRREFLNIRQEDLASISGVNIRTIHEVESGKGNPSIATLQKLGDVLGLELVMQVKKTPE